MEIYRRYGVIFAIVLVAIIATACGKKEEGTVAPKVETAKPLDLSGGAKALQPADVTNAATTIRQNAIPAVTAGDYVIDGEKRYNGWFLSAERIVFKANSKLVFSKDALAARPNFFILAKEIVAEDSQQPGSITWERPSIAAPPDSGAAQAGADNGAQESIKGGNGESGKQGNAGQSGRDGPSLTITSLSVKGAVNVDVKGQDGGPGGKGQYGGRGGGGGHGTPASQSAFDCKRGAGDGGAGGKGGDGGKGGPSGSGGRGGTFTLITSDDNMAAASRLLRVDVAGGQPGSVPGAGGDPGAGGSGGARGQEAKPWCKDDGRTGGTLGAGQPGQRGDLGAPGTSGDYFVGGMTPGSVTELLTKR